ncbi:purine-binding chemotaxis protein CheW [Peribacillus deserti]|uniref:Purine-binding chemotaxis protein CheW n=1 Tax=Peribacillus deserti TaxID=673318 RepID=A0ABS2QES0_9BACI|nr:chemotaxis protein CheW [Peribacillus deserti]MBM7690806.1 purine-binding chemotaxis protein CheW [Peribacillus deserti]
MESVKYVVFLAGEEEFGIPVSQVISIEKIGEITEMPNCQDFMVGVSLYREKVIPVIDMIRVLYKRSYTSMNPSNRMILINIRNRAVGLIVEGAKEILDILPENIKKRDGIISQNTNYVQGFVSTDTGLITLIDLEVLFDNLEKVDTIQDYAKN